MREDPEDFVWKLPLLPGTPARVRRALISESGLLKAESSRAHALIEGILLAPVAYFLAEFLKELAKQVYQQFGRQVGSELARDTYQRVKSRVLARGAKAEGLPSLAEALAVAELYFYGRVERQSESASRVATTSLLATSRVRLRPLTPGSPEARIARLALLASVSALSQEELMELVEVVKQIARERLGISPPDFPIHFTLSEYASARGAPSGPLTPFAEPGLGAFLLYDPEEAKLRPEARGALVPKLARLVAHLAHEYVGHGFVYSSTRVGQALSEAARAARGLSGVERVAAEERLAAARDPLLVVDEGFALWVELAVLKELRPALGESIVDEETLRYLGPDEDPFGRTRGEYFKAVYGRAINPYKEGYSALFDVEKVWGRRCVPEAVKIACDVPDVRPLERSLGELRALYLRRPELAPDRRLMAIRSAVVSAPARARRNDVDAFREFILEEAGLTS